jgi:hypothetical protein
MIQRTFALAAALFLAAAPAALAAGEKAAMDPAQMEKMKKPTSPGDAHKVLEKLAGKWNYTATFTMPDGTTDESTGTADNEIIYGGRFAKQTVKGTWMGQPFEGTGYIGYDNVREEYQSIWIDSSMTGMPYSAGKFDDATQTLSLSGKGSCPLTGEKEIPCRSELKIVDADHLVMTAHAPGPDGKEAKMMEIRYERAK